MKPRRSTRLRNKEGLLTPKTPYLNSKQLTSDLSSNEEIVALVSPDMISPTSSVSKKFYNKNRHKIKNDDKEMIKIETLGNLDLDDNRFEIKGSKSDKDSSIEEHQHITKEKKLIQENLENSSSEESDFVRTVRTRSKKFNSIIIDLSEDNINNEKSSDSEYNSSLSNSKENSSNVEKSDKTISPVKKRFKSRSRKLKTNKNLKDSEKIQKFHPEINEGWLHIDAIKPIEKNLAEQPLNLKLTLLPFQREGLNWMIQQENTPFQGGILADEMGMGKTIQMISLLLNEPNNKPNLIIAPTVALLQWESEIKTHTDCLSTVVYHGANRSSKDCDLSNAHVILTSYNIIEYEYRRQKGIKRNGIVKSISSPIINMNWYRIILDESHYIKDRASNTSRAIFELKALKKWSLSGTPLQNRVGDLYSSIRFLKATPYSYYFCKDCPCKSLTWRFEGNSKCLCCGHSPMRHFCWWNSQILKPIQKYGHVGEGKIAYEKLGKLLKVIMLRRTKKEKADDLGLPPRVVTIRKDFFNPEEEDFYKALYSDTKTQFSTYVVQNSVLNNYANIFELITKMRLAVNHPDLILKRVDPKQLKLPPSERKRVGPKNIICVICQDVAEDPIVSKCKHTFCREDASQLIFSCPTKSLKCPACAANLTIDLSQETLQLEENNICEKDNVIFRSSIVNQIDILKWRSSTKVEALIEELNTLRSQDYTIKSIVFSQFVNFLDLINWRLHKAGFNCCRLDGRMSPSQRNEVIKTFNEKYDYTVFLISLKAGGIALNLTEASHVFLCDPWWNPAVEDQAMDRIHRLGQRRPIKITRLIIEDSIESRILQLQEKKRALFNSTINADPSALSRLTEEDMRFLFVL